MQVLEQWTINLTQTQTLCLDMPHVQDTLMAMNIPLCSVNAFMDAWCEGFALESSAECVCPRGCS